MLPKMHGLVLPFLEEPRDEESRERIALEWIRRVQPHCKAIRSNYDLPAKPRHMGDLAHRFGLQYVGGAWLGPDGRANLRQIELLVEEMRRGSFDIGLLGNEVLFRGFMSPERLVGYLKEAQRRSVLNTFTIAERDVELLQYPEIIHACEKVVGMHVYPFWADVHISEAVGFLQRQYFAVKHIAGKDKKVIILETGWPTGGGNMRRAVASPENSLRYISEASIWAERHDVEIFFFEAMDELWKDEKALDGGNVGPNFGIWHADGRLKAYPKAAVEAAE